MASVYILYSKITDSFYIGSCHDFESRLNDHLSKAYKGSFTVQTDDWELYYKIDDLDYSQARNIEVHIKRMKSRKYLEDLKKYPEISFKLIYKYKK